MAKKKNPNRKHKFKYSEPVLETSYGSTQGKPAATSVTMAGVQEVSYSHYNYVTHDVRRLAVIAVILIIIELTLWYVLGNTPFGKGIYGLFKV